MKNKRTFRKKKCIRLYEVKMGKYLYYVHIYNIFLPISKMLFFRDSIRNGVFFTVSLDYYSAWILMQEYNNNIKSKKYGLLSCN